MLLTKEANGGLEMNKTILIIPAYNEEANIIPVLSEIKKEIYSYDIVLIDDGSQDKTAKIAMDLGLTLICHPVNLGYGGAIQTGLKYAVAKGYDIGVLFDGDGQHDPKEIPKLIKALTESSADVAVGSRLLGKTTYKMPFMRRMGIRLFSFLTFLTTGTRIYDITSGFQAINRKAMEFLSKEYPIDFPDAEVIILLSLFGYRVTEIPVNIRPRLCGQSMYSALRSVYYPFKVLVSIFAVFLRRSFVRRKEG